MGTSGPDSDFNDDGDNEECKITGHQEQLFFFEVCTAEYRSYF